MRVTFIFYCDEIRGSVIKTIEMPDDSTEQEIEAELEHWGREQISLEWTKEGDS